VNLLACKYAEDLVESMNIVSKVNALFLISVQPLDVEVVLFVRKGSAYQL
jgi:hypothetical protein